MFTDDSQTLQKKLKLKLRKNKQNIYKSQKIGKGTGTRNTQCMLFCLHFLYIQTGLDISPPMAGKFHGGQLKFDMYQPGWQALFSKSQADHCNMGRLKTILG